MAKLPLILSIVALLCASGLGIAARQKAERKVKELAATQTELKNTKGTLATTVDERDKVKANLATAEKEIEVKGEEVAKLAGEVKATKDELQVSIEATKTKELKVAELETEVSVFGTKLQAAELAKTELEEKLTKAQNEVTEAKLAYDTLKARQPEKPIASQVPTESAPRPALRSGTILAVNSGLNYVVLSVGDQQGVSVNTPLVVVRGGQRVATLKVTSIEPRASVAEVVPGTLAKGQAVQVGDRVVPRG